MTDKKIRVLIVLLVTQICSATFLQAQTRFTKCDVYQFEGVDSLKKTIVLKQRFNSSGQLTTETEMSDKGAYFYFYKDTLLIKRTFSGKGNDSTKMLCYYNKQNQLVKQEHFTFEKQIREGVDKGLGRPGGCVVTEEDYEKKRTWIQTSEVKYAYDTNGNKILYDATRLHFTSQNRYTWEYDSLGRVIKHSSFADQKIIWIEDYVYFIGGYKYTRTWFDYKGNPEHLATTTWEYVPQYTLTFYLNDKGKVIKEITTTEKGETTSIITSAYNEFGQLNRTVKYSKGKPEITHIYLYQ